nr:16S rRNA (cytosine(967)-C(5))-methyltransferase RsmB [Desulfobacterales bacterium]
GDAAGLPDRRDRDLFNALVFGVLRWRGRLDFILSRFSKMPSAKIEPQVMNILRVALFQLAFLTRVPPSAAVNTAVEMTKALSTPRAAAFVNAVLRKTAAGHAQARLPAFDQAPVASLAAEHSLPEWLVERWLKRYGPGDARALCGSINDIPPLTLRTNTLKTTRPELMQALAEKAQTVEAAGIAPEAVIVRSLQTKLTELAAFRDGWFQVQDEAAQLVSILLAPRPGEAVLDLCAGRGGKTGHIAQLMGNRGTIVAADANAGRLAQLSEEMRRLGAAIVATEQWDAARRPPDAFCGRFDRVLIDAPCSGLGTLGRNPDIRWSSSKAELRALAGLQARLLTNAAGCVRPGGLIVYSVCSPEPEETGDVVRVFLAQNRGFRVESRTTDLPEFARPLVDSKGCLQTYPHLRYMDGFFAARLRKPRT